MTSGAFEWVRRDEPLQPAGVLGLHDVATALAASCVNATSAGAELRIAAGPSHLLAIGSADELPWADGAKYVGWESGLLMSTTHRASVHPDLLEQALRQRFGPRRFVALPGQVIAYELASGPVDPAWLAQYAGSVAR